MAPLAVCRRRRLLLLFLFMAAASIPPTPAGERVGSFSGNPPLLSARQLPPAKETADSNIETPPEPEKSEAIQREAPPLERSRRTRSAKKRFWAKSQDSAEEAATSEESVAAETSDTTQDTDEARREPECDATPPTPEGVESYRLRLQARLLERYNNQPEYAGKVGKAMVILSRPLEFSMDGKYVKAEFDQLVQDIWGKRLPELEREYYVITFGSGGAEIVRSDPSVRVGLDLEKSYSELAPLAADPFRHTENSDAFRAAPKLKMPEWWRPEFPELD